MPLSCSICQLGYDGSSDAIVGALPCGHVFHIDCVQQWFHQSQKTCPACRAKCSSKNLIRLFLDSQNTSESPEAQAVRLESELLESRKKLSECQASLKHKKNKIVSLEKSNEKLTQANKAAKLAMIKNAEMENQVKTFEKVKAERNVLKTQLQATDLYRALTDQDYPERELDRLISENGMIQFEEVLKIARSSMMATKQNHEQVVRDLRLQLDEAHKGLKEMTRKMLRVQKQLEAEKRRIPETPNAVYGAVLEAKENPTPRMNADDTISSSTSMSLSFLNTPAGIASAQRARSNEEQAETPACIKTRPSPRIANKFKAPAKRFSFSAFSEEVDIPRVSRSGKTSRRPLEEVAISEEHRSMARTTIGGMTNRFSRHTSLLEKERTATKRPLVSSSVFTSARHKKQPTTDIIQLED